MEGKKLSEELRDCLDARGCGKCSSYQSESRLTCHNLLQKACEVVKKYEEIYEITGNRNTGNRNTGDRNTGNRNAGDRNTGDWNAGDRNTGDWNAGDRNTGDCNTGDRNTGDRNTGNCNTGDWNAASFSSGVFNTEEANILMFNKPSEWSYRDWMRSEARRLLNLIPKNSVKFVLSSDMTDEEKAEHPTHETTGGYLKALDEAECGQIWWDGLTDRKKGVIRDMPNYDKAVFERITGIKTE